MSEGLSSGRVLITGATGGLGHAIARAFAAQGASLLLNGRRAEPLEALCGELGAEAVIADLSDRAAVEMLADRAGELDVLVANAALPATGFFLDLTQAQIDTILEVNLRSQIALARFVVPGMVQRGHGAVVFIASLSGKAASPASSLYNATKFGLRGFALALREDLHGTGVGVSVIMPGFIRDAGMFADSGVKLPPGVGTRTPDDVAKAVLDAVRHNRAEVTVAPPMLRAGTNIATLAPELSARVQRLAGGAKIARNFAAGQSDKRPPE